MTWQGVLGHDDVVERFRRGLARGRLASTFLFVGPAGVGKRTFARKLAQTLLCQTVPEEQMAPCGRCASCIQVVAGTHPDLIEISKPADRSAIPLSVLVGDDTRRMREGLCHDIALKAFMGGRKVAIIDDADYLNEEGANALLKTLEEPPPNSVLILIGTSADKQLPTIRSRSQLIRFRPLSSEIVAELLQSQGLVAEQEQARRLAGFAEGSLERALELADEELWSFRGRLLSMLARTELASVPLAQETIAFVDAAGKEAPPRRARMRQLVVFAIEFYRQLLRSLSGATTHGDSALLGAIAAAERDGVLSAPGAAAAIARSLEALEHIDRNAHQAALIECWLDDLARIVARAQRAPASLR